MRLLRAHRACALRAGPLPLLAGAGLAGTAAGAAIAGALARTGDSAALLLAAGCATVVAVMAVVRRGTLGG